MAPSLQIAQIAAHADAGTVQPRARASRVRGTPAPPPAGRRRHQQRRAQRHATALLRRVQRRLQPVRRVAAVMHAVAVPPFADGVAADVELRASA